MGDLRVSKEAEEILKEASNAGVDFKVSLRVLAQLTEIVVLQEKSGRKWIPYKWDGSVWMNSFGNTPNLHEGNFLHLLSKKLPVGQLTVVKLESGDVVVEHVGILYEMDGYAPEHLRIRKGIKF